MRVAGVIVEYNPFHNGHLYHLQETRKHTKPDVVIAVMSGNFLQRGEPALLSKWIRTRLALQAGIDLVVELPYAYATQKAEIFAWGAVSILNALGVTHLCFGSEAGDIRPFHRTMDYLEKHQIVYRERLKENLAKGVSYPKAASAAFQAVQAEEGGLIDLSQPNNILGYHYVQSARELKSPMQVMTISRKKAGYHEPDIVDAHIASATAIRKALFERSESWETLSRLVPSYTYEALRTAAENDCLNSWESFFPFLKYRLTTDSLEDIKAIYEAEEGLEYRLKESLRSMNQFQDWMRQIKTKRYTWTRLQRLCTHILTHTSKVDMAYAARKEQPKALRLLGMNEIGQAYLGQLKKRLTLPVISNINRTNARWIDLDIRAASCYNLVHGSDGISEYHTRPIRYHAQNDGFLD